jgi:hypothetical protein
MSREAERRPFPVGRSFQEKRFDSKEGFER